MSAYTNKLQEWVDSVKVCEAAEIDPCYRWCGSMASGYPHFWDVEAHPYKFAFPVAATESKAVFVGDVLYSPEGKKFKAHQYETMFHKASWNPPKNTVMVEMPYQSVVNAVEQRSVDYNGYFRACRKALEGMR